MALKDSRENIAPGMRVLVWKGSLAQYSSGQFFSELSSALNSEFNYSSEFNSSAVE